MSHAIEIEACEWLRLVLDSLETRAGGFAGCGLGLAVCGPVLLTAPPKNRPSASLSFYPLWGDGKPLGGTFEGGARCVRVEYLQEST